mgnify:CR=1 FL=1
MALAGRQIRQLRSLAHNLDPVVIVGKSNVTESTVEQASEYLEKHEPLDAGKRALGVQRALERRCQEHRAAAVPQGLAQSADGGGRDNVFPTGLHDMKGHGFPLAAQAATMLFLLAR